MSTRQVRNKWTARIISLLIVSLLFVLLNYIMSVVMGRYLAKSILQDEGVKHIVRLIKDSNVDYRDITIVMNSERSQPLFAFYIIALALTTLVVSVYSLTMAAIRKVFHLGRT